MDLDHGLDDDGRMRGFGTTGDEALVGAEQARRIVAKAGAPISPKRPHHACDGLDCPCYREGLHDGQGLILKAVKRVLHR